MRTATPARPVLAGPILAVLGHTPVSRPSLRLYLLHHAGGSHTTFRPWLPLFPPDWELRLVVAPGRPKAASHPAERDLRVLGAALADHLATLGDDEPYALFGHSMGGLVAFDAALAVQELGARAPQWVGVSGHPGPFGSITRAAPPLYGLPPEQLRAALTELGGLPERVLTDPLLWRRVQPLVRADLEAAETWRPRPPAVLRTPLSAFCGDGDPVAVAADAVAWATHSTAFLGVRQFPGGHFYFLDDPAPLVNSVVGDVRLARSGATAA